MIGRLHHVVLDCPQPAVLAEFYSELLGLAITYRSDDWVVVADRVDASGIAFQKVADYRPPVWGDPGRPQQFHLDVMVDDVSAAEEDAAALGARRLHAEAPSVWADLVGHPFCLIPRPSWAPPIG